MEAERAAILDAEVHAIHHLKQAAQPIPDEDTAILQKLNDALHEALGAWTKRDESA